MRCAGCGRAAACGARLVRDAAARGRACRLHERAAGVAVRFRLRNRPRRRSHIGDTLGRPEPRPDPVGARRRRRRALLVPDPVRPRSLMEPRWHPGRRRRVRLACRLRAQRTHRRARRHAHEAAWRSADRFGRRLVDGATRRARAAAERPGHPDAVHAGVCADRRRAVRRRDRPQHRRRAVPRLPACAAAGHREDANGRRRTRRVGRAGRDHLRAADADPDAGRARGRSAGRRGGPAGRLHPRRPRAPLAHAGGHHLRPRRAPPGRILRPGRRGQLRQPGADREPRAARRLRALESRSTRSTGRTCGRCSTRPRRAMAPTEA